VCERVGVCVPIALVDTRSSASAGRSTDVSSVRADHAPARTHANAGRSGELPARAAVPVPVCDPGRDRSVWVLTELRVAAP
jgi:hypothetical protein